MRVLIKKEYRTYLKNHWQLYLLLILPLTYVFIFYYGPIYGAQIAFREFDPSLGITGSPWIGFDNFIKFLQSYNFLLILKNTLGISVYQLVASFPFPILLALAINEVSKVRFKKLVQFVTYAPHFISTVVVVSILIQLLSPSIGIVNNVIELLGGERTNFMAKPGLFKSLYVWSHIWQSMGFGSIIYLAALTGIDLQQHDAATVDGASRIQRIWHVDIPAIMPTIVILLILQLGRVMSVGVEKVFLMQNPLNLSSSDRFFI